MTSPAPKVEAQLTSESAADSTSLVVTLPTTPYAVGDMAVVVIGCEFAMTPPAGWTEAASNSAFTELAVFYKTSDGTESGSTATFTASSAATFAAVALRVSGAEIGVFASASGDQFSSTVGFEQVETLWQGYENLYIAAAGWRDDDETVSVWPPKYLHSRATTVSGGGIDNGVGVAVATRRFTSDSDTPGNIILTGSDGWSVITLAVRGAAVPVGDPPSGADGVSIEAAFRIGQDWHSIGEQGIYRRNPLTLKHGRSDWASQAEPSSARFTLENRLGQWSPDNVDAPFHPDVVRNMQTRIGVAQQESFLEYGENLHPFYSATTWTPDDASLDITGDIDVRFEVESTRDLEELEYALVASKRGSWNVFLRRTGSTVGMIFEWSDAGGSHWYDSTTEASFPWELMHDRISIRVTLDVSTGEGVFYYAPAGAIATGPWTQVATIDSAGATDIVASTGVLALLSFAPSDGSTNYTIWRGRLYAFQLRDGIAGTLVADVDATGLTPGASSFVDDSTLTWTIFGNGRISATRWRFHGEVASLPTDFDLSGNDQWIPIEANGLLRRLRQGNKVLSSPIRRAYDRQQVSQSVASYWPMEEKGDGSLSSFGAVIGPDALRKIKGAPTPGSDDSFEGSDKLPVMATSGWVGVVGPEIDPGLAQWMVRFLLLVPENPSINVLLIGVNTGSVYWQLYYNTTGTLQVLGWLDGVNVHVGSTFAFGIEGQAVRFSMSVSQDGADVDVAITSADVSTGVTGGGSNTFSNVDASWPDYIEVTPEGNAGQIVMGHIAVENIVRTGDLLSDLAAFAGETAANRIVRLCAEEGIASRIRGKPDESLQVGPQSVATLVQLLEECADTDLGVLYDPPDVLGVGYRTGATLRNQNAAIDVNYAVGDADGTLNLKRDDKALANDVTVTSVDGSTSRAVLESGRLSILEPPDGAGRYDTSFSLNTYNPIELLPNHASTRLALGTVDEPRLSQIVFALHSGTVSQAEKDAILRLNPGDLMALTGLPPTIYQADLGQIVQGWTERIDTHTHHLTANTSPGRPWTTGILEGTEPARYDALSSVLVDGAATGATSLTVETLAGEEWTVDSNDWPFEVSIDRVIVNVTAVADSGNLQTFTVTAIDRDLPGGSQISLANPTYWSL